MHTDKLSEKQELPAQARETDGGHGTESLKLVEMGPASVETKGFFRGVEIGFTPRS